MKNISSCINEFIENEVYSYNAALVTAACGYSHRTFETAWDIYYELLENWGVADTLTEFP
jgi:hypothetical protein